MPNIFQKIGKKYNQAANVIRERNSYLDPDGRRDYVIYLYKHLLARKPSESEIKSLAESNNTNFEILQSLFQSKEYKALKKKKKTISKTVYLEDNEDSNAQSPLSSINFSRAYIVGENKPVTAEEAFCWYQRVAEELINQPIQQPISTDNGHQVIKTIENPAIPTLTIITSLYKGEDYIKTFLENITSQTIFEQCQLFIINANSPQNEYSIIKEYLAKFPNIKYLKLDKTIGIYEAWNLAIKQSESEFLTNANVDDLHRKDALELKVNALRENPETDVVYSDVFYSFLPNLPFEIAEKGGIKTNLPTANKFNLLSFNSPHNSPLWRRSLHETIGYFDPTYQSAGDHEFWLRAAFSGVLFMKISEPVVVYYQNPNGISTQKHSPGDIEGPATVERYRSLLS